MNPLDRIAIDAFGITRTDALEDGICIRCKRDIVDEAQEGLWNFQDTREYFQSGICPVCFDEISDEMEKGLAT